MGTGHRSSVQLQLIAGTGGTSAAGRRRNPVHRSRDPRTWRLDARTRAIGREGVAQAKEILAHVRPPEPPGHRRAS